MYSYEFHDYYRPARLVGGDFFDYLEMPSGEIAITVADVSGKGVPAALFMARLYSSVRFHLLTTSNVADAMSGLNSEIAETAPRGRFITCVMAVLDPSNHKLHLANAGHIPPVRRDALGDVALIGNKKSGMPLGILPKQEFRELHFTIKPADTWLFVTDGITEAMNPTNQLYTTRQLSKRLRSGPAQVEGVVSAIVEDVERFCEGRAQGDDICLVGFRRMP